MTSNASIAPTPPVVRAVTVTGLAPTRLRSSIGTSSTGDGALPCLPTAPYRTVPSRVLPARNEVLARDPGSRPTMGCTRRGWLLPARLHVTVLPAAADTYCPPLHCDSPVHASFREVTTAPSARLPLSASITWTPSRTRIDAEALAPAARSGVASSVCMVSRPWIVDSAPEL